VKRRVIRPADIEQVISELAKIPARSLSGSDRERLSALDANLKDVVFGQDEAIDQVVRAIQALARGAGRPNKPVGSYLFTGPTGVGKTEVARQLAAVLRQPLLPLRHERVHGKARRVAAHRRAAGLRRL